MEILLELLKLTVPTLVAIGAVYLLFNRFLTAQHQLQLVDIQKRMLDSTLPMRLQAYERLSLYCERIQLENLLFRLHVPQAKASDLRSALLLTIQQEYEHNISQQMYVTGALWQIIKAARDMTRQIVLDVAADLPADADNKQLEMALLQYLHENNANAADMALQAIRTEASGLFGK
jgi:hypothetical protein